MWVYTFMKLGDGASLFFYFWGKIRGKDGCEGDIKFGRSLGESREKGGVIVEKEKGRGR